MALFAFLTILATTTLGWGTTELTTFGLLGLLGGASAGMVAGRVDARLGARNSALLGLCVLLGCTVALAGLAALIERDSTAWLDTTRATFWYLALGVVASSCLGLIMASSRAIVVRLAPVDRLGQYFGLYVMVGRASSFAAPFLVALIISLTGSARIGVFSIAIALLVGGILLLRRVRPC